ncbi:DNA polymerase [Vibrio phage VAP7]|uniref:DNA-directed DNA polymerase n=1 Tax=Vibrio phage VAP7 TaxID=2584487 RepID=A0A4Y5TVC4_9CAUD|nr:DNA polymerase [Vibrio phage VAP7]QDB73311.1 DNA polymerase [Vibrio phage VAP7]UFD98197.1 hypothetical protein [Vibrio phage BX-1]
MSTSSVFYTNVARKGNKILARICDEKGQRRHIEHHFKPEFYIPDPSAKKPHAMGLGGERLKAVSFDSIWDANQWLDENKDVYGYRMFGINRYEFQFIAHKFRERLKPDDKLIRRSNVDIEVITAYRDENGNVIDSGMFPHPVIEEHTFKTKLLSERYQSNVSNFYRWFQKEFPESRVPNFIDYNAAYPISLIQHEDMNTGVMYCWALPEQKMRGKFRYDENDEEIGGLDVVYKEFQTEQEMLADYLQFWRQMEYDAWTGWNIEGFDAPYLVERVRKILGEEWVKMFSVWGHVKPRTVKSKKGKNTTYDFVGTEMLDYQQLYDCFTYVTRENMKLDTIAYYELDEKKMDYSEAKSLHTLYFDDYIKYVRYGIKDIKLVSRLENKLNLMRLAFTLAYISKCNYRDTLGTTAPWSALMYNRLLEKGMRPEIKKIYEGDVEFGGGYVKNVVPGLYRWVVSVDLNSLYPHLIQQYNIGTETLVTNAQERSDIIYELVEEVDGHIEDCKKQGNMRKLKALAALRLSLVNDTRNIVTELVNLGNFKFETLKRHNVCMAPNMQFFRRDKMSVLSEVMRELYATRKIEKKLGLTAEQKVQWIKEEMEIREGAEFEARDIEPDYDMFLKGIDMIKLAEEKHVQGDIEAAQHVFQMGYKILMNSGYGAIGSVYFSSYFDLRVAEAITFGGQLINRWNIRYINEHLNKLLGTNNFDYAFYGDTDSNYITLDNLVKQRGWDETKTVDEIVHLLDEFHKEHMDQPIKDFAQAKCDLVNGYEQRMFWEREVIAQSAVWVAPKMYAMAVNNSEGTAYAKPKVKVMGLAAKKSNYPEWCRKRLTECYKEVLLGTEVELKNKVKKFREEYMALPVDDIAAASSISDMEKYLVSPTSTKIKPGAHYAAKAGLLYNQLCDKLDVNETRIQSGDKVKLVNLTVPNPTGYNYMAFPDYLPPSLNMDKYVDYKTTFQKKFLDPLETFLKPTGMEWKKRTNLRKRFGKK